MGQDIAPFIQLRDYITGEMVSKAIHVAAELGCSDLLDDGPKTITELAELTGSHEQSLNRLLRLLASYGIYRQKEDNRFELTPTAALMKSGDKTLHSFIKMFSSPWNQKPFNELLHAVKTGKSAFESSMEKPFFDYIREDKAAGDLFNKVMTDFLSNVHAAAVDAYDFSIFDTIIDVGGGHGSLISKIVERYPIAQGIVFDLPSVIEGTKNKMTEENLNNKIRCVAGDFFTEIPKDADAYLLCRVIHDWDDEEAIQILSNCRRSMNPNSRLLLVEQILQPGNEASFTKVTDLWMMMMFHQGRERTESEFIHILSESGFTLNRIIPTNVHDSIIEVIPKK